jgi:hypothetical protein
MFLVHVGSMHVLPRVVDVELIQSKLNLDLINFTNYLFCIMSMLKSPHSRIGVTETKLGQVGIDEFALFHSNGCTSNTQSLPQPNASYRQNYTPVSVKCRYASTVSFQTTNTTTVKTTHLRKTLLKHLLILLVVKTVNVSVEGH